MSLNHSKIAEAFQKYPMCKSALVEQLATGAVSGQPHAVCAVGALVLHCGAMTVEQLAHTTTDGAIYGAFPKLQETYGFRDTDEVLEYVSVNDVGEDNADNYYGDAPEGAVTQDGKLLESNEGVRTRLLKFLHTKLPEKRSKKKST